MGSALDADRCVCKKCKMVYTTKEDGQLECKITAELLKEHKEILYAYYQRKWYEFWVK